MWLTSSPRDVAEWMRTDDYDDNNDVDDDIDDNMNDDDDDVDDYEVNVDSEDDDNDVNDNGVNSNNEDADDNEVDVDDHSVGTLLRTSSWTFTHTEGGNDGNSQSLSQNSISTWGNPL